MPKLILRCNYLKNSPPAHLANYINYIGTREGVEKVGSTTSSLPATDRQKSLIEDILAKIPDANRMHEYHDYIQRPTRENASEFITQALENNLDIIAKKKNYMDYLANRPGVEIIGTHGLFSKEIKCDILSFLNESPKRKEWLIFTEPIFTDPNVLVGRTERNYIEDISALENLVELESLFLTDNKIDNIPHSQLEISNSN